MAKIKAHNPCGNRNPTLRLLLKPVGAYNLTQVPNASIMGSLDDIEMSDMQDEEWVEVKEYCEDGLTKEEIYT